MLRAEGYSIITSPGERDKEHDTFTCAHCNAITFTKSGLNGPLEVAVIKVDGSVEMKPAAFCRNCFRHICPRCDGKDCVPLMKKIECEEVQSRKLLMPWE
jgi:hypothetical protein